MMTTSRRLTLQDLLELSASLGPLAGVCCRFLPLDIPKPGPSTTASIASDVLLERTVAIARAGLYNFLSITFGEPPSARFVDNLLRNGSLPLLADKGLQPGLRHWGEGMTPAERVSDLASAYTRLFTRPGPHCVPAAASDYLDPEPDRATMLSWGSAAEEAVASYRDAGLIVAGDSLIAPDHLAVEMQFMHHCAAREAAALTQGDGCAALRWREQGWGFLTRHLSPWVELFRARVGDVDAHLYYRAMADLTADSVAVDARYLAELLGAGAHTVLSRGDRSEGANDPPRAWAGSLSE